MPRLVTTHHVSIGERSVCLDVRVEPGAHDEDRVAFTFDEATRVVRAVVADGAGNSGRGAEAAELAARVDDRDDLDRLESLEPILASLGAEVAIVSVTVHVVDGALAIEGAAVGDVRAWARCAATWHELTAHVPRKPLVGGGAHPLPIGALGADALIIATDGAAAWSGPSINTGEDLIDRIIEELRGRSALHDDLAMVWLRLA
jgi:hypothetical protein